MSTSPKQPNPGLQPSPQSGEASGPSGAPTDFIRDIISNDRAQKGADYEVVTRFPPEPNGYLHIGHAKSICLNFGIAKENTNAVCHLRFDDTNPAREDNEYVESIQEDVRWLGFDWGENKFFASDYFEQLYEYALELIRAGKAFVCDLSPDQMIEYRGTPTIPGKISPFRDRTIDENLDLFQRMRSGEFPDGSRTLRAKIDMASPNIHLRDPALYRIRKVEHHRTGSKWCIYPMYDYAHCVSDAIEGITHSICTLEFEVHRPLYDWILNQISVPSHPRQIEFARLNLSYTMMSKRKLLQLVQEGLVEGWDDPRMPTIAGLRKRGYTPESIRAFCSRIGVTKYNGLTDVGLLEFSIREDLNKRATRVMGVLRPLKLIIENLDASHLEFMDALNNPEDPSAGLRKVAFTKELYIEEDDFMETPPKGYFRLSPGSEVRLRYAYIIKCVGFTKDPATGKPTEIRCTIDPETKSGSGTSTKKVKGTIHWVSASHNLNFEARLYDRLFTVENPGELGDEEWKSKLNPNSFSSLQNCFIEPGVAKANVGSHFQLERIGYFTKDSSSDDANKVVLTRTVGLKDSWTKGQNPISNSKPKNGNS